MSFLRAEGSPEPLPFSVDAPEDIFPALQGFLGDLEAPIPEEAGAQAAHCARFRSKWGVPLPLTRRPDVRVGTPALDPWELDYWEKAIKSFVLGPLTSGVMDGLLRAIGNPQTAGREAWEQAFFALAQVRFEGRSESSPVLTHELLCLWNKILETFMDCVLTGSVGETPVNDRMNTTAQLIIDATHE